jgi:drug/metabolite transporter (DMT)-like permease
MPRFFSRLPRGLRLAMLGLVLWLVATVPLAVYLLLVRVLGQPWVGPGLPGLIAFALNVVAVALVIGGVFTWVRDDLRRKASPPSPGGTPGAPR